MQAIYKNVHNDYVHKTCKQSACPKVDDLPKDLLCAHCMAVEYPDPVCDVCKDHGQYPSDYVTGHSGNAKYMGGNVVRDDVDHRRQCTKNKVKQYIFIFY